MSLVGPRRRTTTTDLTKGVVRLGLQATGLWRRALRNGLDIRLRAMDLHLNRLPPAFDGYRVLQISDPHFDAAEGLGQAVVDAVTGTEVDLCVLTGDFRAANQGPFTETGIVEPLGAIRERVVAPDGFFLILGNHDVADMVDPIERLGYRALINETHRLRRGGQEIALTGIDDVHEYYTPAAAAAVAVHDPAACGILLAHSPEFAGEAAAAGFALYLCGHCHGGQLCLPGGWPLITHLLRHQDLYAGLWRHGAMVGYTSPGAGLSTLPVRLNCPAEVTLFRLRADPDQS